MSGVAMKSPLRAIVVEDEFMLAEILADALVTLGCEVLGSAANVDDGVRLAGESQCDFAIVDLNLKGKMAFPVLDRLHDRGIPCLMATGAFAEDIPPRYLGAARLSKPYDIRELQRALGLLMPGFEFSRRSDGRAMKSNVAY
jgi:DNA-binding response OmpR family regulator